MAYGSAGCKGNPDSKPDAIPTISESLRAELTFVPAGMEVLARLDLAGLAAQDPEAVGMLEFLLRAQQPAAGEVMDAAGLKLGQDVRALLFAARAAGAGDVDAIIAAVGSFDGDAIAEHVAAKTGMPSETADGGELFIWHEGAEHAFGSAEHEPGERDQPVAIGVTSGLIVLGGPRLVKDALAVRSRGGEPLPPALVLDVALAPAGSLAWGAARGAGVVTLAKDVAPGLLAARFHAGAGGKDHRAAVALRAEFATIPDATAFQARLTEVIAQAAALAGTRGLGATLAKLRDDKAVQRHLRIVEIVGAL